MSVKPRNPWFILVLLAMAQFIVVLDTSIVNVALPAIQKALHFSTSSLQWTVTAYTLAVGGFLLLGGRAADLYGRRKVFLIGLGLFAVASLADGLAQSGGMLIASRAIQGLAGALMSPAALSIVLVTFKEGAERNKALAVWGAVASGGAAAGMLLGGILTEYLNWRWNFFVNVPVGATIFVLAMRVLPKHESEARNNSLDLPGALSITGALMSLVYGLTQAPSHGWLSSFTLAFFASSAALLAFFIWNERRAKHPLVDLSIFKVRNVTGADLLQIFMMASLFSVFFFTSLYIQTILGYSPVKTGLSFLAIPVVIAIAATNAPKLIAKFGYKRVLMVAPLFVAVSMLLLAQLPLKGNYFVNILPGFILMGLGLGLSFVSTTIAATSGVKPTQSGLASGLLNTSQQIGGALGLAILSGVVAAAVKNKLPAVMNGQISAASATLHGYHLGFYVASGFALIASLVAVFVLKHTQGADPATAGQPTASMH
ncbi:MAG TPA: MFS transporter [Candidatus Saccharimonadales bacterium]|nr:MFS transporter [Candidatus Saccharimonadales bacterium]